MAKQQTRTYAFTPGTAGLGTLEIMGKWDLNQITLTNHLFIPILATANPNPTNGEMHVYITSYH